jgi:hypothetical protein
VWTDWKKRTAVLACVPVLLGLAPGIAAAAEALPQPETAAESALVPDLSTLPAEGPGSVVTEGEDVVVEAHFEDGVASHVAELEEAGATVLETSTRYQTVALSVAPEDLEALAEVPGLEAVEPSLEPVFYGAEEGGEAAGALEGPVTSGTSNGLCEGGSVVSQAMTQLSVASARGVFGARGAGQTIGVISDSYNMATEAIGGGPIPTRAHEDEVSNDLPGLASTCSGQQVPVRVIAEGPAGTTDEGRAMLQVIHDLAPHAELAFATAYSTELEFAKNIERLAAPVSAGGAGADVIVDDVGYFAEPFFQDGPVAVAIKKVTQEGVSYLTAAGNDNLKEAGTGNEFGSWEREEFADAPCPAKVAELIPSKSSREACLDFSPNGAEDTTFGITVERESQLIVDLQWAEPWYGVESDLNAYLLNAAGEVELSETVPNGTVSGSRRQPLSLFGWENPHPFPVEMQLVVDRCIRSCNSNARISAHPRVKFILMEDGGGVSHTEYPRSEAEGITVGPTIYGHAGAAAAITLAAVGYQQSASAPVEPERYSSRGPVTHYYGPVSGTTPAAKLSTPERVQKPNVTATDCASTTFFASLLSDGWHFCGTSQAAPHAAAIAALMRQTQPLATPSSILAKLESSATPFTKVKAPEAVGAGLVNAEAAIAAIGGSPVSDPASTVVGAVEVSPTPEVRTTSTGGSTSTTKTTAKTSTKSSSSGSTDTSKPKVKIVRHPKALERTRGTSVIGRFRFSADQSGVTFSCQVDKAARRACGQRFRRRFKVGRHVVRVRAVDSADGSISAPATFRFRVQRVAR